jgi:type I restriction enzyme S subunit
MTSRWDLVELADAGVSVLDCEHKTPPDAGYGHPYIAIPNLVDGRLDLTSVRRITDEHLREWTRRTRPQAGDIIVTRRGRVGDSAVVPEGLNCAIGQNLVILRSVTSRVDQSFLRYAARGRLWADEVDRLRNVGAVFDSLNVRDIARIRIPIPPLEEQRVIASVLGALDDKIDSNRHLVLRLEQIVAAVFRARFVNFVGENELVKTELGRIPKGWNVAPVGDSLTVVGGGTPSTKEPRYWDGGTNCWATPKDLAGATSLVLLDTQRRITNEGVNRISSRLLPERTVLLSSRAPVGYTAMAFVEVAVNQGFIAIPPSDSLPSEYVLLWLRENMDRIKAHAGGTTFAEISKRAFRPMLMLLPPPAALTEFQQFAAPVFDLVAGVEKEAHVLSEARDVLLPRLVSGQIRVPDATDADETGAPPTERLAGATG